MRSCHINLATRSDPFEQRFAALITSPAVERIEATKPASLSGEMQEGRLPGFAPGGAIESRLFWRRLAPSIGHLSSDIRN